MDLFANLIIGIGTLLLAQAQPPHATRLIPPPPGRCLGARQAPPSIDGRSPWYIILNSPQDLDELWRKLERPDLVLIKGDQLETKEARAGVTGIANEPPRGWWNPSRSEVGSAGEFANLNVELAIVVKGAEPSGSRSVSTIRACRRPGRRS